MVEIVLKYVDFRLFGVIEGRLERYIVPLLVLCELQPNASREIIEFAVYHKGSGSKNREILFCKDRIRQEIPDFEGAVIKSYILLSDLDPLYKIDLVLGVENQVVDIPCLVEARHPVAGSLYDIEGFPGAPLCP